MKKSSINNKSRLALICFFVASISLSLSIRSNAQNRSGHEGWEFLLDMNLSNWDKFLGVPHYTVDLDGYEKGDGMEGTPIGLNKDPLHVFTAIDMEGETVLKISGEIYGGLSTKKQYENYHLSLKYKWGTHKYEPRLNDKRDSGVLYHCQEPHGAFWNVWMQSQEMQVQEGDSGDYYTIAGTGIDIKTNKTARPESKWDIYTYDPNGEYKHFKTGEDGRCRKIRDYEKKDDWNQLDLISIGDKSWHIVNGNVVMVLENSVVYDKEDLSSQLSKGKIQIQSEGAEVYYKDIKIKSVSDLPKKFKGN